MTRTLLCTAALLVGLGSCAICAWSSGCRSGHRLTTVSFLTMCTAFTAAIACLVFR